MPIFEGVCTALVTPFTEDSKKVDYNAFKKLIDFQIENSVSALLFLGTTGEPATLSENEKVEIVKFAIQYVKNRVPVLVGAGSNSTEHALENSVKFEKLGADALLLVTPYYNKCTQGGLVEHYSKIAENVKIPIIVYNVPGRTGVNILPETIKKLKEVPNIVGVKEASGNIDQIQEIASMCDDDFNLYCGDDALTYTFLCLGAKGVISVASNVIPKKMSDLCKNFYDNNLILARSIQFEVSPLVKSLFSEVNPIPVKRALNEKKIILNSLRLPLTPMSEEKARVLVERLTD